MASESEDQHAELMAAGFTSIDRAQEALRNLRERRDQLLNQHLDVSMYGGGDFGNRAVSEKERSDINQGISEGGGLTEINDRIKELEGLLSGQGSSPG